MPRTKITPKKTPAQILRERRARIVSQVAESQSKAVQKALKQQTEEFRMKETEAEEFRKSAEKDIRRAKFLKENPTIAKALIKEELDKVIRKEVAKEEREADIRLQKDKALTQSLVRRAILQDKFKDQKRLETAKQFLTRRTGNPFILREFTNEEGLDTTDILHGPITRKEKIAQLEEKLEDKERIKREQEAERALEEERRIREDFEADRLRRADIGAYIGAELARRQAIKEAEAERRRLAEEARANDERLRLEAEALSERLRVLAEEDRARIEAEGVEGRGFSRRQVSRKSTAKPKKRTSGGSAVKTTSGKKSCSYYRIRG